MKGPSQLPLDLDHTPHYGRDSFMTAPSNAVALALIESWPNWPAAIVLLSGPSGSGKTHLAHIWAARAAAVLLPAALVPGQLTSLATEASVVVEDIDPHDVPERQLFHLVNTAAEAGASLLLTSRRPVADWRLALPDLRSRMRLAAPARLEAPDDDLLRKVLVKLFADRQLGVEKAVIDFLLLRMERSLKTAVTLVDTLDREALATGRAITRPLASSILARPRDAPGFPVRQ